MKSKLCIFGGKIELINLKADWSIKKKRIHKLLISGEMKEGL